MFFPLHVPIGWLSPNHVTVIKITTGRANLNIFPTPEILVYY